MATKKRKKRREQDSNPLKMGFYIIAVLALMACLVFFVYRDREKDKEFEKQVEELSARELSDMWDEIENEGGTVEDTDLSGEPESEDFSDEAHVTEPDTSTDLPVTEPAVTETAVVTASITPATGQLPEGTPVASVSPEPNLSVTPVPAEVSGLNVLILNGTRRPGVAGYWKTVLEQAGYTNVVPVTYTGTVGAQTVIYTDVTSKADYLLQQFPNASIQIGSITTGLEPSADAPLPEHVDIYILIGSNDARSS